MLRAGIAASMFIAGLSQIGLYSSNKDMKNLYQDLYAKYQHEVLSPKHRGLKLKTGKRSYQIDEKEFTSSRFDDLKELVFK